MTEYEVGYKKPKKGAGFDGHPENINRSGFWRKEDTARYKIEQMLKMTESEIRALLENKDAPLFERRIAKTLLKENEWKTTESMINQVYGQPKQSVETIDITPPPLSPRKQKKG